jgi:hypothetical protein
MRRTLFSLPILLLTGGCNFLESWKYKVYPPNPFPDIETVAVLPFINQTASAQIDGVEMGNLMANELAKFVGLRPLRPQLIRQALGNAKGPSTVEEAIQLGRRLQADAVIAVAVTDYDPYVPPRLSVSVQFLRVSARRLAAADVDRLVQSASWRRGPMAMPRDRAGHWVAAFEDVYDAHEERIRVELSQYAQAQEGSDTPFTGDREFLAVQSRFVQFVCNQVIHHVFDEAGVPE